ncbi:hypothetical protein PG991_000720 [Apiospora marii]|uniref:Azaphilone pigments biosynthesis cluster protein L N-terminal domain-containing protein n=1 Tax=Apiospora marii TaxID=335849 RepID=A0ABR1SSU4_9PEZI
MDPLSVTASIIAVAGLATQSAKAATKVINGLQEAPQVIAHSKFLLAGTENSLSTLVRVLDPSYSNGSAHMGSILSDIRLQRALDTTRDLCDDFTKAISGYTVHSTELSLSKRDRIKVNLHEGQIARFNRQLSGCQDTITVAVTAATLIVSCRTSDDIERMSARFIALEQSLSTLMSNLSRDAAEAPPLNELEQLRIEDEQSDLKTNSVLQDTCKAALEASRAKRTGQTFGDMNVDKSTAMQGIVGTAQQGVEQKFGNLVAQNESRAFQGQMDSNAFSTMFK